MDTVRICKNCRQPLPENAPEGLCSQCRTTAALAAEPALPETRIAPEAAELAPYFPQLEIIELLGMGGMGIVYKARQPQLDRLVALKILPMDSARHPSFAERFSREAKALARLNHSGIVDVYDFGQTGPYYYFIMEFVDGMNLRQLLDSQTVTPRQTLELVMQICTALQYAHDEGVVHRDIKPANILVNKKGQAKIADFGLAKLLGATPDTMLTTTQAAMGTLNYMAPEQRENAQGVDHRADIFSLGVVFYEMLTGEVPMGRFEPPSKKVQVDVRLDEVVLRALEREPARRYQHASDLKSGVEAITHASAEGTGKTERPASPPRPRWLPAALLSLTAVLASAALLLPNVQAVRDFFSPPTPDQLVTRAEEKLERYDLPGHIDSAMSDLKKAVRLDNSLTGAYAMLGLAYWRSYCRSRSNEVCSEALSASLKALEHNPNCVRALLVQGLVEEQQKRLNDAKNSLTRANDQAKWEEGEVLIGLATVYADLKDMSNSSNYAQKAGMVGNKPWYFFKSMGYYQFTFLHDAQAALSSYRAATNAAPNSPIALTSLGGVLFDLTNRDEHVEALRCLQKSLSIDPTGDAYNIRGLYYLENKEWMDAARDFEEATKCNLERYDFPGNKGLALIHLRQKRDEARKLLSKALDKARSQTNTTQDSLAVANIGLYQAGLGQPTESYNTFRQEMESSPDPSKVSDNIEDAADLLDEVYHLPAEAARLRQLLEKKTDHH
jgi:serine/threonine protein kinase